MTNATRREAIAARLREIEAERGGLLTPMDVEKDARDSNSPLHHLFEWDDAKAALAFRLDQARNVIVQYGSSLRITSHTLAVPFYIRDPRLPAREQGYISTDTAKSDRDLAQAALCEEFGKVAALLRRARILAVELRMEDQVEGILRDVVQLREIIYDAPTAQQ